MKELDFIVLFQSLLQRKKNKLPPWETEIYVFEKHKYFVITYDSEDFTYYVIYFNVKSDAFTFCRDYKKIVLDLDEDPNLVYAKGRISRVIEDYNKTYYLNLDDFIYIDDKPYLLRHSFYRGQED